MEWNLIFFVKLPIRLNIIIFCYDEIIKNVTETEVECAQQILKKTSFFVSPIAINFKFHPK